MLVNSNEVHTALFSFPRFLFSAFLILEKAGQLPGGLIQWQLCLCVHMEVWVGEYVCFDCLRCLSGQEPRQRMKRSHKRQQFVKTSMNLFFLYAASFKNFFFFFYSKNKFHISQSVIIIVSISDTKQRTCTLTE